MKTLLLLYSVVLCALPFSFAQKTVVRDIRSFGAKGDGIKNDHEAFQKAAAYFNDRGGNGTLIISKGIYLVGKQTYTGGKPNKAAYEGEDVLYFRKVKNVTIKGNSKAVLRYKDSLRFGAFDPITGMPYEHGNNLFRKNSHAAYLGSCISLDSCENITVTGLTINGNSKAIITGGVWGDVGRQLTHYGIFIVNSRNIIVDKCTITNMALDGINVCNKESVKNDRITLSNSTFDFNARQGLSYTGGNNLFVKNCKFNNTGKGAFSSPPAAGVDIEAECGRVTNGYFTNCEFINNTGVALLAHAGEDSNFTFTNCTFWGVTNWSIWVTKPAFTFNQCNIYGSIVWGYNSPDEKNATKYINCTFEDKPYKGKEPFGNFIIESNNARRMSFKGCKFITNKKRLSWISIDPKISPEEKYQFTNCSFVINNPADSTLGLVGVMRGSALKDCTFDFKNPRAKMKGLSFLNYSKGAGNVDLGGNRIAGRQTDMINNPKIK